MKSSRLPHASCSREPRGPRSKIVYEHAHVQVTVWLALPAWFITCLCRCVGIIFSREMYDYECDDNRVDAGSKFSLLLFYNGKENFELMMILKNKSSPLHPKTSFIIHMSRPSIPTTRSSLLYTDVAFKHFMIMTRSVL